MYILPPLLIMLHGQGLQSHLSLGFPICKVGMITLHNSENSSEKMQGETSQKDLHVGCCGYGSPYANYPGAPGAVRDPSRRNRHTLDKLQFRVLSAIIRTQSMLIIHGFCICRFAYSLKLFITPHSILVGFGGPFLDMHSVMTHLSCLACTSLAQGEEGNTLPPCFSNPTVSKYPLHGLFGATFFEFLCFLWVISLFKTVPKHSAEVLLSLSTGGHDVPSGENTCDRSFIWARVTVQLAMSSMYKSTISVK